MSAEDPLDEVTRSISDGKPVDWELAESGSLDAKQRENVAALRDVEKIAEVHRALHRPRSRDVVAKGEPMHWGDLTLLELVRTGANGEVWRAWDVWLQREVALKFLQVSSASSGSVGESALLDEARALARVRHPGVVSVHGIAEHDRRVGMWMEFLEGTTLAAEIERRGAMPALEVARIGLDLCRALTAVESAGIVHGDIKPANIVIEETGRVVLTDFGLGRRWELADPDWRTSGTPIFMSPGVLSGQAATPRSDVYSLGVTLRWALTGRPPFSARSFEELKAEAKAGPSIALRAERPDAPRALIAAIDRAMAPDSEARYPGAAPMAADLERVLDAGARGARRRKPTALAWGAGAVAVLGLAALVASLERRASPSPTSFSVSAPSAMELDAEPSSSAISPDGRILAFVASDSNRARRLWLRPLGSLQARPVDGSEGADGPFWSPDSRHLGFFADGKMKRVSIAGGAPEALCAAPDPRGATWGKRGVIVFAPSPAGPLCRVSAEGGPVGEIVRPDSTRGETALRWPEFLPDGRHFLFVSLPPKSGLFDVHVGSIDSRARTLALRSAAAPVYAGEGRLLLVNGGRLMVQRFDLRARSPVGDAVSIGPATTADVSVGERLCSASTNGVLIQPTAHLPNTRLVLLDREGNVRRTLPAPEGRYEKIFFSPDGRRLLAVGRSAPNAVDLWMIDVADGLTTRLTSKSQTRIGGRPCWSPDGRRVAFSSNRDGLTNIYQRAVSQAGEEELLYQSAGQFKEVNAWSPDGRYLIFEQVDGARGWDLWLLPVEGIHEPVPYLRSAFNEIGGMVSPDGRWAAYSSDESGKHLIYVQSFPEPGERSLVAPQEGAQAWWSRDGRELLFYSADGILWTVPTVTAPSFEAGTPRPLFRIPNDSVWMTASPDARSFVLSVPAQSLAPATVDVTLNWPAAMEK